MPSFTVSRSLEKAYYETQKNSSFMQSMADIEEDFVNEIVIMLDTSRLGHIGYHLAFGHC